MKTSKPSKMPPAASPSGAAANVTVTAPPVPSTPSKAASAETSHNADPRKRFYLQDIMSTRWFPKAPPRAMQLLEGWGFDSLPDLSGRVYIVTGGSSGIGLECSRELARAGAQVIVASPDPRRAEPAIQDILRSTPDLRGRLDHMILDLASLSSIRSFAQSFLGMNKPLAGLLCNAALQLRDADTTADGLEQRWGANFVGHFYLAHLLLGALDAGGPSRLVFQSSLEEQNGSVPWDDPLGLHAPPRADWYSSSKLANLMVALEMGRRLRGTNVDVFCVHPGIAQTDITYRFERHPLGSVWRQAMIAVAGQSAYRGALPLAYAAAEPALRGRGAQFIGPRYYGSFVFHAYSFSSLTPLNPEARSAHARFRLYEQTADALEAFLVAPLPNRLRSVPKIEAKGAQVARGKPFSPEKDEGKKARVAEE